MIKTSEDIVRAVTQAKRGDTIVIPVGSFELDYLDVPAGVSIVGAGSTKSRLRFREFRWWKGALQLHSENTEIGRQRIEGLYLDGQKNSFGGLLVHNRSEVVVSDVVCRNFYDFGLNVQGSPQGGAEYVELSHFDILNCGRESSKGASGNIRLQGLVSNLTIRDGVISHTSNATVQPYSHKRSGYGIKADKYYTGESEYDGLVRNSKIQRVRFHSKAVGGWAGNFAPNINIEFWKSQGQNVEISGCYLPSSMSLEHNAGTSKTFHVHSNYFATQWGQSLELAAPNSIIEWNVFDFRKNTNAWGVTGNYNSDAPIRNISFFENDFLLGHHTPHLYRTTARLDGFNFLRNKVFSEKEVVLLELETPNTAGCNNIIAEDNYFHAGYIPYSFTKDASVPPTGIFQ